MRLNGVDGSHLLGFMCALGTLRLLDEAAGKTGTSPPKLSFAATCIAEIEADSALLGSMVGALAKGLDVRRRFYDGPLAEVNKPADFSPASFKAFATTSAGWERDALAGLACGTGEDTKESTLCAANGASHQELIRSIRDVLALVQPDHLSAALLHPWAKSYEVPSEVRKALNLGTRKPTLRLDPADERLYALRATNPTPSSSQYKTELGAQALAVAAFELLPVCPRRFPVCIASRTAPKQNRVFFSWCLWQIPSTLSTIRSLLAAGPGDADDCRSRGAFAAFEVARVTGEKGKLSIAPTTGLW